MQHIMMIIMNMKIKKNLLTKIFLLSLVISLLSIKYCSTTYADKLPVSDKGTNITNQWFLSSPKEWPIKFRPGTRGGNGRSSFYTDIFIPVLGGGETLFFANPKLVWDDANGNEQNIGCGIRNLFFDDSLILGGNFYFDTRETKYNNRFNQLGFGAEALSKWVDFRTNFYLHLSDKKEIAQNITGYSFGTTTLIKHTSISYEEPFTGFDYEGGLLIPYISNYLETKVYIGGYHYFPKLSKTINGIRGRIELRPTPLFTLDAEVSGDNMSPVEGYIGGYVSLPFSIGNLFKGKNPFKGWKEILAFGKGTRPIKERMTEMVRRDIDVILQASSTSVASKEHDLTYVDNSNAGAEDGSQENPYNTVQEGIDNAIGDSWVYVQEGTSDYTENVILANGVTLWGSLYNGGFKGISSDSGPTINKNGSTVTMASNSTLMGFTIKGGSTDGVHAQDKTNFSIIENNITASNYGIQVRAENSTCATSTISGNTISNINGFGAEGIYLYSSDETVSNFSITENTISIGSGVVATGIDIYNDGGSMPSFNIIGNTISNFVGVDNGTGISINNEESTNASAFTLTNNVVTNMSHFGIMIIEAPGSAENSTYSLLGNTVADNDVYGVAITGDAGASDRVDLGGGSSSTGYNSFYNNGVNDVINADGSGTLQSQYNWWGQAGGPSGAQTAGNVNTANYLTSNPN